MARHATYKWGETAETVVIKVSIPNAKKQDFDIRMTSEGLIDLTGRAAGIDYALAWRLRGRVRAEEARVTFTGATVDVRLPKVRPGLWLRLQARGVAVPPYEFKDWDMFDADGAEAEAEGGEAAGRIAPDVVRQAPLLSVVTLARVLAWAERTNPLHGVLFVPDMWDVLMLMLVQLYVYFCPYTKVEESFNMQATHDLIFHPHRLDAFDHFAFPGVVPRTFIGPLALALVAGPPAWLARLLGADKLFALLLVRWTLGLAFVVAMGRFRREVEHRFGEHAGVGMMVASVCQFHLMFYASRTLPNSFALVLVVLAYTDWMQRSYYSAFSLLTFTTVVFRAEVVVLLGPLVLQSLLLRRVTFWRTVRTGLRVGVLSLAATVAVDTYYWQRPLWPEGEVLYFNAYLNKSHEWGVSPFHWYVTRALPKALLGAALFVPVAFVYEWRRVAEYLVPMGVFVFLYSFLPHKELRFIFYVLPMINMAAGVGIGRLYRDRGKPFGRSIFTGVVVVLFVSLLLSTTFFFVSTLNYPGGHALHALHRRVGDTPRVVPHVHIGVEAAMTGVTRFGQEHDEWVYRKDEGAVDWGQFTHLLSANRTVDGFFMVHEQRGFDRISLAPPFIIQEPKVFVHVHRGKPAPSQ